MSEKIRSKRDEMKDASFFRVNDERAIISENRTNMRRADEQQLSRRLRAH
jgi:hypothetical protein